jgi:hypothetical protein
LIVNAVAPPVGITVPIGAPGIVGGVTISDQTRKQNDMTDQVLALDQPGKVGWGLR